MYYVHHIDFNASRSQGLDAVNCAQADRQTQTRLSNSFIKTHVKVK